MSSWSISPDRLVGLSSSAGRLKSEGAQLLYWKCPPISVWLFPPLFNCAPPPFGGGHKQKWEGAKNGSPFPDACHKNKIIFVNMLFACLSYTTIESCRPTTQSCLNWNDTNSNACISYIDYPIFLIFYSHVLGWCENMPAKFQVIRLSQQLWYGDLNLMNKKTSVQYSL